MSHELYFVPILAQAIAGLGGRDPLVKAFAAIEEMGRKPGYEEGYHNFCWFLAEAVGRRRLLDEHSLRTELVEWIAGTPIETEPRPSVLSRLVSRILWMKEEFDSLDQAFLTRRPAFTVELLRDGEPVATLTFETAQGRQAVESIGPGHYTLGLDSGLVLWEGVLTAADLIWTEAFGSDGLALAAETADVRRRVGREIRVAEAGLVLRLFPGLESGMLEIELTS